MYFFFEKETGWIEKWDEHYTWSSSRPHLNLHQTDFFFFLSLFPFFLSLRLTEWWLQTFLWEKKESVFTRCGRSGILMSQHEARTPERPTRTLEMQPIYNLNENEMR